MNVDKKVGITLQGIGLSLLVLTAAFDLHIFWAIFGMACLTSGTYKLCKLIFTKLKPGTETAE